MSTSNSMATADPTTLRCPRCDSRMDRRLLPIRHQRVVEVDHCGGCRLVWFDAFESVSLTGLGWVMLLRLLQDGAGLALPPARPRPMGCPRCAVPLKAVHNRIAKCGLTTSTQRDSSATNAWSLTHKAQAHLTALP